MILFILFFWFYICITQIESSISTNQRLSLWKAVHNSLDLNHDGIVDFRELINMYEFNNDVILDAELENWIVSNLLQNNNFFDFKQFVKHYFHHDNDNDNNNNNNNNNNLQDTIYTATPEQIHLSLTSNTINEMIIMWVTDNNTMDSVLYYSTNPNNVIYNNKIIGDSTTYDCGILTGWHGRIHFVLLKDLLPNTKYYYMVGDNSNISSHYSTINSFKTLCDNYNNIPMKIAIFGDMGTFAPMGWTVSEKLILDDLYKHSFDLIVHVGDVSYGGTGSTRESELIWDIWGRQVEPLTNHIPYMITVGNHEHYYNFTSFKHRFIMPGSNYTINNNLKTTGLFYYSYNVGLIHFISMCTESIYSYAPGSEQYEWLINDLNNINREITPWVILLGHRPMYSSDLATDSGPLQQYIEPLMIKYNIDLGIWGHMHEIERTYPVNNYTKIGIFNNNHIINKPNAPIHLIIGTAGAMINEKFSDPQPEWSVYRNGTLLESPQVYGYGYLEIYNSTHLYYEFTNQKYNHVLDYMWIIK